MNIGDHDYDVKKNSIIKFLNKNNRVRIVVQLKGREKSRPESSIEFLNKLYDDLSGIAVLEQHPNYSVGNATMIVRFKK